MSKLGATVFLVRRSSGCRTTTTTFKSWLRRERPRAIVLNRAGTRTGKTIVYPHFRDTMRFEYADTNFPSKLAAKIKWNREEDRQSVKFSPTQH